ncbi:MAG: YraN family protein [Lachnospiraceae bacterium]|nr:YraN family protein [Lachnospiraceae bacterium]
MNKRKVGAQYEELAADFLIKKGIKVLERNFRCRGGEIDLIGKDGRTIVFFEVKYRKNKDAGYPIEAVDHKKQATISRVADYYRLTHGLSEAGAFRFDVIGILGEDITWYRNAFEYVRYYR